MEKPLIGKKILIVEDEVVFRSLLDTLLTGLGASTFEAGDGLDGPWQLAINGGGIPWREERPCPQ